MHAKDRLLLPDTLRGIGLLGIAICNAPSFFYPYAIAASLDPPAGASGADLAAWFLTKAFCDHRFLALFAMLFGVSLLMLGGDGRDPARSALLDRRLAWLGLFGIAHGALIWWGDILLPYAAAGLVAARCRGWTSRALFVRGSVWFVAGTLALHVLSNPAAATTTLPSNLGQWLAIVGGETTASFLICTPMMLIGMGLWKSGALTASGGFAFRRPLIACGVTALVLLCMGYGAAVLSLSPSLAGLLDLASILVAPLIAVTYAALIAGAIRRFPLASRCARAMAPAGRMALTNYLLQSSLLTAFALFGMSMDRALLLLLVLAIWSAQLFASNLWLARHHHGPVESLWRRLYAGPPPARAAQRHAEA